MKRADLIRQFVLRSYAVEVETALLTATCRQADELHATCGGFPCQLRNSYVLINYISPARARGETTVTVRAGDVHKAMGLQDAMPAVASALGANKFQEYAHVRLVKRDGPQNGANLLLTYRLSSEA